ncbi:hypothetical protein BBD42_12930 [Paenibacillus sp. BIHB 4019]|uniref:Uncharacterized protein n=1 Tax=Paenibacillus sp. BIHB 4019 TaxID=1870819 RepID=A0A1B2DHS0_9BACL|nr:hypothetical protein [Paenibacillus sp. BIHB 4019]ANY67274.1 hypothetical protein BBD42_12930 [Paenibacillus sp. BIHB 4019]
MEKEKYIHTSEESSKVNPFEINIDNSSNIEVKDKSGYFGGWPIFLRWISFLPATLVTAIIAYICIQFFLTRTLGPEDSLVSYLIHRFAYNCCAMYACIYISCEMVPKGKIVLSSIYLAIIILFIGFVAASAIYNPLEVPVWKLVYEGILTMTAGILALLNTISESKKKALASF